LRELIHGEVRVPQEPAEQPPLQRVVQRHTQGQPSGVGGVSQAHVRAALSDADVPYPLEGRYRLIAADIREVIA